MFRCIQKRYIHIEAKAKIKSHYRKRNVFCCECNSSESTSTKNYHSNCRLHICPIFQRLSSKLFESDGGEGGRGGGRIGSQKLANLQPLVEKMSRQLLEFLPLAAVWLVVCAHTHTHLNAAYMLAGAIFHWARAANLKSVTWWWIFFYLFSACSLSPPP